MVKLKEVKPSSTTDPKAENELVEWCRQWYGKRGMACFTGTLHAATHGRFHKYDNRSLSGKMKQIWKELGATTDGIVSPCAVAAPSVKELMAKSRKGGKLGMEADDDEGK